MKIERLAGESLDAALDDLARLRLSVFRAFPYLYEGDAAYEAQYLRSYRDSANAVIVVARDGHDIVGAATGMPLADHADAAQIQGLTLPIGEVFYCAESVLLPAYRGRGAGHAFFDHREEAARDMGFAHSLFVAVVRSDDHPQRPAEYRPLDGFWRKRGYVPLPGATATFHWTDIGDAEETPHRLQAWSRAL